MIIIRLQNTLFLFILLFTTHFTRAQTGTIMGRVVDSQADEELIGVTLRLESTSAGAISDIDGNFIIQNVKTGNYTLIGTYMSYETYTINNVTVNTGDTTHLEISLKSSIINLEGVNIVARKNREVESVLLADQRNALIVTKSIGATELSRKGIGDAESAVSTIAGISKQEGVKNIFVRGLGDRYNATLLNGQPVPSEDPEYKNISLSFFDADIIKNIGVEKVFSADYGSDVGGAVININSKELNSGKTFGLNLSTGFNLNVIGNKFFRPDGINYWGFSNTKNPKDGQFNFPNSLDPHPANLPINDNFRVYGGKRIFLFDQPLSFYGVISHSSDHSYTDEAVRNTTTDGTVYQDQQGKKYSGKKSQLALANINYNLARSHSVAYNFLMLHSTQYYVGEYFGKHSEKFQDAANDMGFLRRQQVNDNILFTHQLISKWKIGDQMEINADLSFNRITGNEPDRRENYLSQRTDGTFGLTGSNRQKRFYSQLIANDYNAKIALDYLLGNQGNSKVSMGFNTQVSDHSFHAEEFNFSPISGIIYPDNLMLDQLYNQDNFNSGKFSVNHGYPSSYGVDKNKNSAFTTGSYQFNESLSGVAGFQLDWVTMKVSYDVPGQYGSNSMNTLFYLPNLHLKYNINDKQILRLGASKTYTLPQAKEISPYQYVNIGFTSEGNPNLRHSDNYNLDIKWDNHFSDSEIISFSLFYKKILNPIGRVDKGNSAGLLTYDNISNEANLMGIESELRKNLLSIGSRRSPAENNFSFGMNFSYIFTSARLDLENTPGRPSALEGASPLIANSDLTYHFLKNDLDLTSTIKFNYFSDRIFTIGAMDYNDIIEKAVPTLDFAFGGKISKALELKLKAGNILDPSYRLTRDVKSTGDIITLSQYRKGVNLSIGVSIDL